MTEFNLSQTNYNTNYNQIRKTYKPNKIKILFLGESRPVSGKFFYNDDTTLLLNTKKAFEDRYNKNYTNSNHFRNDFKNRGCYLYDVCNMPINQLSEKDPNKKVTIKNSLPNLITFINSVTPDIIIVVKKGLLGRLVISKIKEEIKNNRINNKLSNNLFNLPFPAFGNQKKYRDELIKILP